MGKGDNMCIKSQGGVFYLCFRENSKAADQTQHNVVPDQGLHSLPLTKQFFITSAGRKMDFVYIILLPVTENCPF